MHKSGKPRITYVLDIPFAVGDLFASKDRTYTITDHIISDDSDSDDCIRLFTELVGIPAYSVVKATDGAITLQHPDFDYQMLVRVKKHILNSCEFESTVCR